MLYSFVVLLFGIYIGQDYPMLPSIKILVISLMNNQQIIKNPNQNSYYTQIINYFLNTHKE